MDPATRRQLKEKLLQDVDAWDQSQRGFQDIVRNAADIDKKILYGLMKAFQASRDDVREWGSGTEVPEEYKRYVVVEKIRELLVADLGS
ncbi:MAG: hypothetical protein AAB554_00635 [Patescibacteria group bacterium]